MRWIIVKYNRGAKDHFEQEIGGTTEQWGCNKIGEGVFRRSIDGSWTQNIGTSQTPTFRKPSQLRKFIRDHFGVRNCRIVDEGGWPA